MAAHQAANAAGVAEEEKVDRGARWEFDDAEKLEADVVEFEIILT